MPESDCEQTGMLECGSARIRKCEYAKIPKCQNRKRIMRNETIRQCQNPTVQIPKL